CANILRWGAIAAALPPAW
nr:immunoglobulin heavy chain junction region [Macaca mulatta]MOY18102.1 immunoglobulin heavy chain junction region [Macaca mulatta]MOY18257.1 immunoglobulin heavy chain junction region [Macaca mulatta]MOY18345.1 immunoglobulin heavy chain junction region [Macaca mulatta]MOY18731.1 immunoglobulin heavy chain junction region [Macaca mulatta]